MRPDLYRTDDADRATQRAAEIIEAVEKEFPT